jgi:hypothetical protein
MKMVQIWRKARHDRGNLPSRAIKVIYFGGAFLGFLSVYNNIIQSFQEITYAFPEASTNNDISSQLRQGKVPHYPRSPSLFRSAFNTSSVTSPYDPIVTPGGGWDVSPVVIEKYKLIFFTTPKIGTTVFKQLFRRMMGFSDWPIDKDPNIPHNPLWNGLQYLYHYPPKKIQEFLTSPNWTRAVFVRDPKDRVLSAYLDKAIHQNGTYLKRHCCGIRPNKEHGLSFKKLQEQHQQLQSQRGTNILLANSMKTNSGGTRRLQASSRSMNLLHSQASLHATQIASRMNPAPAVPYGANLPEHCANLTSSDSIITFETFIQDFLPKCDDPHWRPQAERMDEEVWKHINFVGHFDRLEDDARKMMERIGAWEEFGVSGWQEGGPVFARNAARHKTSAHDRLGEYYTPQLERMVYQFYKADYEHATLSLRRP